jgi:hypothetical protein
MKDDKMDDVELHFTPKNAENDIINKNIKYTCKCGKYISIDYGNR